jgi:serine/threonine-protein kinase
VADADLVGSVLDGRYQVIEPIAEGAMGSVYRGERLKLGRAVAIKIMHQELPDELASRQRFEREAKLMALLEHPNCVSVIDFGVHDDKPFLVMDLVRGTSLLQMLDKVVQLPVERAADITRQVLSGLAHAHELGIIHRDIKPANIMLTEKAGLGEQVRILDFGLARMQETSTKLTTGIVVGTPNYMAPEQCKGSDVDARADLYACGVMLFEMLTGRKPFVADEPLAVVRKHLLEAPPTLGSVEPRIDFGELEAVMAKALAKNPADRYESAVAMSKAVEAAAAKVAKTSAAALFARAVPESAAGAGNQQATMSGWNVPADARSAAIDPALPRAPHESGPVAGSASVGNTSGPFTGVASIDPSGASAAASGPSMGLGTPAASLPPLPQAGPYVPPPGIGAPVAPVGLPPSGPVAATTPDVASAAPVAPMPNVVSDGTPDAPLTVPPTRPSTATPAPPLWSSPSPMPGPLAQLPLSKRQLMIGGGGLLVVIVLIAVIAGGGSKKSTPSKPTAGSGSATVTKPVAEDTTAQTLERAKAAITSEDYDSAVELLKKERKNHPDNAELAFLSGKANFGRLWWTDGIDDFRTAIKLDPSYKTNDDLLKTVLKGFLTTPDVDERITSFMRRDIGLPLKPYLEETAQKHPKKNLRARAQAELDAD